MGKHTASYLSILGTWAPHNKLWGIKIPQTLVWGGFLFFLFLLLEAPASAFITFEAVKVDGQQIYSGDSIPSAATFNITITSSQNLSGTSPIVIRVDGTDTSLTPSTTTAGTITTSHSQTFTDGLHNIKITAKDTTSTAYTWEATHLNIDSAGELRVLGTPLNYPNPCTASDNSTKISYTLSKPANITLSIHDIMGNLVRRYSYSSGSSGGAATYNEVAWDIKTDAGTPVGNGIYIYLIIGDGKLLAKGKIAVIK